MCASTIVVDRDGRTARTNLEFGGGMMDGSRCDRGLAILEPSAV
jgi:hypothetical protein